MNCSICDARLTQLPEGLFVCPSNHVFHSGGKGTATMWEQSGTLIHRLAIRLRDLLDDRPVSDQHPVITIAGD